MLALVLPILALVNVIFVTMVGWLIFAPPRRKTLAEKSAGENPRRRFDDQAAGAPKRAAVKPAQRIRPPRR
ncbi:hypothetical protein [Phenylobacterium sp.]|uniref:hypothetical protein n=1 Tax=Phenylobacterium sp. TaxID=1871053 RepID=UPI0012060465|nr:hypothetical protein [Phenylobacterium sp.]THD65101.1 MAG: hypothetical protein E8A49_00035 [Phenylobacterium sp.]